MGLEFLPIFKDWAKTYDEEVAGNNDEYKEVFKHYTDIIDEIAMLAGPSVLEFGSGTGNLTERLLYHGKQVFAVEPSDEMRNIALSKATLNKQTFVEGDMLNFPHPEWKVDTIVANLVFHHLTLQEKEEAIKKYSKLLPIGGKIIFGDTMFLSPESYRRIVEEEKAQAHVELAADLEREYYPLIPDLARIFEENGWETSYKQMNRFVWIFEAIKMKE